MSAGLPVRQPGSLWQKIQEPLTQEIQRHKSYHPTVVSMWEFSLCSKGVFGSETKCSACRNPAVSMLYLRVVMYKLKGLTFNKFSMFIPPYIYVQVVSLLFITDFLILVIDIREASVGAKLMIQHESHIVL